MSLTSGLGIGSVAGEYSHALEAGVTGIHKHRTFAEASNHAPTEVALLARRFSLHLFRHPAHVYVKFVTRHAIDQVRSTTRFRYADPQAFREAPCLVQGLLEWYPGGIVVLILTGCS